MIMKEFDVVAFCFNKTGVNEVTLTVQTIEDKYTKEQEAEIRKTIQRYIGDDATLNIVYVDHFEPLKNGKRRYFMNDLSDCQQNRNTRLYTARSAIHYTLYTKTMIKLLTYPDIDSQNGKRSLLFLCSLDE